MRQGDQGGYLSISLADYFDKGISMGSGQAPVKKYNEYLRDLIVNGRAKPSQIVSHRIHIDDAPDAYDKFEAHRWIYQGPDQVQRKGCGIIQPVSSRASTLSSVELAGAAGNLLARSTS